MSVNKIFSHLLSLEVRKDISFIKSLKKNKTSLTQGQETAGLHSLCIHKA